MIVSTPLRSRISYMLVDAKGRLGRELPLISSGLLHPQGIAVDQKQNRLLVADPDTRRIFGYPLRTSGRFNDALYVGEARLVADDVEARWVDVDGSGNIWFSDEPANQLLRISADKALRGDVRPEVVYDGQAMSAVSGPGGLALDGFHTYWVNKHIGSVVGSLVRASEAPDMANEASAVQAMASNTDKSYGICLGMSSIFYTQPNRVLYGVKKTGGAPVTISEKLTNPRGCVWDGDGTVYIADRGANAIYSFAANMKELSMVQLKKEADFEDAFGVVVYNGRSLAWRSSLGLGLVVSLGLLAS